MSAYTWPPDGSGHWRNIASSVTGGMAAGWAMPARPPTSQMAIATRASVAPTALVLIFHSDGGTGAWTLGAQRPEVPRQRLVGHVVIRQPEVSANPPPRSPRIADEKRLAAIGIADRKDRMPADEVFAAMRHRDAAGAADGSAFPALGLFDRGSHPA